MARAAPGPALVRTPGAEATLDTVRSAGGSFFTTDVWFRIIRDVCGAPEDRDRFAVGGVPLRRRQDRWGVVPVASVAGLTTVYSCEFDLTAEAAATLGSWAAAARRRPGRADVLRLEALRPGQGALLLQKALREAGYLVECYAQFGNWYMPAAGVAFDAYWTGRPAMLRNTVLRKQRTLQRAHRMELEILDTAADGDRAAALYADVDGASWKPPEPYPAFMPRLIRDGLAAGAVEVGILHADGVPAAVQVWIVWNGRATIFKLSYRRTLRPLSPGTVLTRLLVERALNAGRLHEIDFGRGDDPYKRMWLPHRRERIGIAAYEPGSPVGLLLAARNLLPRTARRLIGGGGGPTMAEWAADMEEMDRPSPTGVPQPRRPHRRTA